MLKSPHTAWEINMTDQKKPEKISDEDLDAAAGGVASNAGGNPEGLRRQGTGIWTRDPGHGLSTDGDNPQGVASQAGSNPEGS